MGAQRGRRLRHRAGDGCDEAIAAARDGLDVGGLRGVFTERDSDLGHGACQGVVAHVDVAPDGLEELLFRDEALGTADEIGGHGEGLGLRGDELPRSEQAEGRDVQGEWPEAVDHGTILASVVAA